MASKNHRVKTWPDSFQHQLDGDKTFELRFNDRLYQKGDTLTQCEFDPNVREVPVHIMGEAERGSIRVELGYTGREFTAEILLVCNGFGLQPGYVCMQLGPLYAVKS